ncbi:MAG: hypothetical protein NT159_11655 [Proteobacteria bacterium]|nr:hypothetical protein [Pseudomonadota bacterium]
MSISSVSSSSSTAQHAQLIQASKPAEEPVKARQPQEQAPEPAKPVVNVQGETTGKVINTSA